MWLLPFLDSTYARAVWWNDTANVVLIISLIVGVLATFVIVRTSSTKEEFLKRDLSEATTEAAKATEGVALAHERTAQAEVRIAEAQRETEKLREKNIALERAVSPRILEQHLTGESLKSFANAEVAVISLSDFEPRRTAGQIRFMLRSEAGWKNFSGALPSTVFFDGVVIHCGTGTQFIRTAAEALVLVLKNNGIDARTGYPVHQLGDNGILVVVGPKPLPFELQLKPENVSSDKHGNRVWGNILE